LSEYKPIKIDNGKYLVGITDSSEDMIILYHGIMSLEDNDISLYMDSYKVTNENLSLTQAVSPMAAGTLYEVEPDNSMSQAMTIYNDYDVYGRIYDSNDVDWYKVQFSSSGSANFWLGNIPSGEDFDLEVYNSAGTLLGSSRSASSQELITLNISANTWYYIKVYGYNGSWSVSNYFLRAKVNTPYSAMGWSYFFADTSINKISSPYGPRSGGFHNGIDVIKHSGSILGIEILSVTSGIVARRYLNVPYPEANWSMGYAISIKTYNIDPNTGQYLHTLYMHLRDAPLPSAVGNYVAKGEKIGYVGSTGDSSRPHLHFQVTKNGAAWADGEANNINPAYFFPNIFPQYQSYAAESYTVDSYSSEDEYSDILIPLELVEYVGLKKFTDWIISQKNANNKPIKFDINEFRGYFNITDDEFIKLVQSNNLEELYNITEVISEKSIL